STDGKKRSASAHSGPARPRNTQCLHAKKLAIEQMTSAAVYEIRASKPTHSVSANVSAYPSARLAPDRATIRKPSPARPRTCSRGRICAPSPRAPCGHARRDHPAGQVARHAGARPDDGPAADRHAPHHPHATAEPDVLTQLDRRTALALL